MKDITYTITKRYFKTLCRILKTNNRNKVIDYLNKTAGIKGNIARLNIKNK